MVASRSRSQYHFEHYSHRDFGVCRMAKWLLDCQPLCGRPWMLGLATEPAEREQA